MAGGVLTRRLQPSGPYGVAGADAESGEVDGRVTRAAARKRTGPTGWSRCFILLGQNRSAGGTTTTVAFYGNERMLARDPFEIGYLP